MCLCVNVSLCKCVFVSLCLCVTATLFHCFFVSLFLCVTVSLCHCVFVSLSLCVQKYNVQIEMYKINDILFKYKLYTSMRYTNLIFNVYYISSNEICFTLALLNSKLCDIMIIFVLKKAGMFTILFIFLFNILYCTTESIGGNIKIRKFAISNCCFADPLTRKLNSLLLVEQCFAIYTFCCD